MNTNRTDRLTERQKQCLRLLYAHYKPGEIATRLGISTDRVNQLLKAARERLEVSRSIDAARILHEAEADPSHIMGAQPVGVAAPPRRDEDSTVFAEPAGRQADIALREEHAPYQALSAPRSSELPLPVPTRRRPFNELIWYQRAAWGLAIALGATVLAGAMVSLQNAIH
ncbi:sigma factor-like helix-turn-helix DNA-binding protein [Sphingomonas morindae]|uniref:LuxR C-terminal-related transcriptional regulator n=1 Tax=Sphingomonas morindae TaxID=1541170 RepID=A0ABY4X8E2_9SPHN|nr:sigma factor-like helix-turn-helix DNA-binding protein [Sphingomonas morindae]USI73181.1 LuxR C-terminal-related transcriptional regulator [Sphingomonas morindae]